MNLKDLEDLTEEISKLYGFTSFGSMLKEKSWITISNEIQTVINELDKSGILEKKLAGMIRGHAVPQGREAAKDIDQFGDVLSTVVEFYQKYENPVSEEYKISVRGTGRNIEMKNPTLSWKLLSREPGLVSAGGVHTKGTQEMTPHLRGVIKDPKKPNKEIHVYGQRFDNLIEIKFTTMDSNSFQPQILDIEHMIKNYSWFFSYKGFQKMIYVKRGEDTFMNHGGDTYYSGCLIYKLTTEALEAKEEDILRNITIKMFLVDKYNKIVET